VKLTATAIVVVAIAAIPVCSLAGPSIAGNFQDPQWNPADPTCDLVLNATTGIWELTKLLPPETIEYKAVDGDAWGLDFPQVAWNQSFTLGDWESVTWYVNLGYTVGAREGDEYVFHSTSPPIVCGDFMSEIGGTDWDETDESLTVMSDPDGDGVWEWQGLIPAGEYEYKIVLNNNWDQDTNPYGYPYGPNFSFYSDGEGEMLFRYHMASNETEVVGLGSFRVVAVEILPGSAWKWLYVRFSSAVGASGFYSSNYSVSGSWSGSLPLELAVPSWDPTVVELWLGPAVFYWTGETVTVRVSGVSGAGGEPLDPAHDTGCCYFRQVFFEVDMSLYVAENGVPSSVHLQGDSFPLTWEECTGPEARDDGEGTDLVAGDYIYTTSDVEFPASWVCGDDPPAYVVKYKYVLDCSVGNPIWEGAVEYGHYFAVEPGPPYEAVRERVSWLDLEPTTCDVGVRFQVHGTPGCGTLQVRGSEPPLDWTTGVTLSDDGTGGDLEAGDGVYSALVVFPTGTYEELWYKYVCDGVFECDGYPDRHLTLDDVNGCMPSREGPMEVVDLWDWCSAVTGVDQNRQAERSWGRIKAMYRSAE
jgi:hypothetical protein